MQPPFSSEGWSVTVSLVPGGGKPVVCKRGHHDFGDAVLPFWGIAAGRISTWKTRDDIPDLNRVCGWVVLKRFVGAHIRIREDME